LLTLSSPESDRIDSAVTAAIAAFGGVLKLAVAPLMSAGGLMVTAGIGALTVALLAWRTPVAAPLWYRHACTAASLPVSRPARCRASPAGRA
jgi:hypothetical protein